MTESGACVAPDRDLPRVDDDADLAPALVGRVDAVAALEVDHGQAVVARLRDAADDVGAGERRDEDVGRAGDEALRRAVLVEAAVDDHADLVGQRRGVLVVVGDEQRRQPELAQQLLQLAANGRLRVRVERRERLVEQQHAGVARERAGERDALALAARELGRLRVREVRDAEALEVLVDAPAARRRRRSCARSCAGRARTPGTRARRGARRARGRASSPRRATRRRRARSCPAVGRTSPATERSTDVLPAPDGPTSATVPSISSSTSR